MNSNSVNRSAEDIIAGLACWTSTLEVEPLVGGLTNSNYLVTQSRQKFVVRLAHDLPEHNIYRWHEVTASKAAYQCGVGPRVIHHETGAMVLEYINGRTCTAEDICLESNLDRIVELLHRIHRGMRDHWSGAVLSVWPFQVVRSYSGWFKTRECRHAEHWPMFLERNTLLEQAVSPVSLAITHNDLLPANFMDDGCKIWLIDWEYAGMNSELFDLACLSVNNSFAREQEERLLKIYYGVIPTPELMRRFYALIAVAALREAAWSMVQEVISTLDQDYPAYTDLYLARFETAFNRFTRY